MRTLLLFALALGATAALADDTFACGKRGRKSASSCSPCEPASVHCAPAPCHTVPVGCCGSATSYTVYPHGASGPAYLMPGAVPPGTTVPAAMPPKK